MMIFHFHHFQTTLDCFYDMIVYFKTTCQVALIWCGGCSFSNDLRLVLWNSHYYMLSWLFNLELLWFMPIFK